MQVDSVCTSLTSHFTANSKYLLLIYYFHCIIDNHRSTIAPLSIKALTMTLLNRSYFFTLSFQCMSGTDASESIRSIAGGWGSVFCRLIILQLAAKKKKKQAKSPLNKKQATHALCKQSSTHLGRPAEARATDLPMLSSSTCLFHQIAPNCWLLCVSMVKAFLSICSACWAVLYSFHSGRQLFAASVFIAANGVGLDDCF